MKTHIMFRRVLTALAFAAVLALPPGPVRAQSNDTPQAKKEDASRAALAQAAYGQAKAQSGAPVQYDLEIEDGALRLRQPGNLKGEYAQEAPRLGRIVKLLRDKHPEANIAMAPELEEVDIADLKLHAAAVGEELEALRIASGSKFIWSSAQLSPGSTSPLFTLQPSEQFLRERAEPRSLQVEVFNFSSYFARQRNSERMDDAKFQTFKDQTIDTTKDIIGNTLASLGPHPMMNFQFHPGANLLVITGSLDEISIARKVINAMIDQPREDLISPFAPGQPRPTRAAPAPQPNSFPAPVVPGTRPSSNQTNKF